MYLPRCIDPTPQTASPWTTASGWLWCVNTCPLSVTSGPFCCGRLQEEDLREQEQVKCRIAACLPLSFAVNIKLLFKTIYFEAFYNQITYFILGVISETPQEYIHVYIVSGTFKAPKFLYAHTQRRQPWQPGIQYGQICLLWLSPCVSGVRHACMHEKMWLSLEQTESCH